MDQACPISFKTVNEKAVRINAVLVILSIALFLFTPFKWIIFILAIDFFIRGFLDTSYSYYSFVSKIILRIFKVKPSMTNAGPKFFAAKIGFVFSCVIILSYLLEYQVVSIVISLILGFFAFLEAAFKFCLACKVYPLLHK